MAEASLRRVDALLDDLRLGTVSPPSLSDELTVVLVTSFTEACPSTTLIEAVVASFGFVEGLEACRLIIVCDGCTRMNLRTSGFGPS
jgi:hypothetical protein